MSKNELAKVKEVIDFFIENTRRLDYEKVLSVVHPDGRMFGGNVQISKNLWEHWKEDYTQHREKHNLDTFYKLATIEILSIEVVGTIAHVKLLSNSVYGVKYIDYHCLVKINDDWKIVSKVSHRLE